MNDQIAGSRLKLVKTYVVGVKVDCILKTCLIGAEFDSLMWLLINNIFCKWFQDYWTSGAKL